MLNYSVAELRMKTNYNNIREREEAAQTLLAAYRQGDQNAFMSLYDMYAEMLLNYGLCITSDKELVKDCVQDVFIKLISKSQDLQVTKVTSYLLISLRNRLLDEFRRKNYMTETAVEDIRISTTVEDVENSYILDESSLNNVRKVQILMDELTPRQRQVFTLYYIEQRKYEDICDIMQMNYHSVRNLVHRGMLKLRAAVAV